jgi:branched-chain amino acid transport system ATP-binding protein
MLKVRNLTAYYDNLKILDGISLDVNDNELVALIGNNGAGKSTFLSSICGVMASSGTIELSGTNISKLKAHQIFKLGMSLVTQDGDLFPDMTVLDNLSLGAYKTTYARNLNDNLQEVFNYFPVLGKRKHQRSGSLSGGEQRMLAIGRALMSKPKFLLLDEPSSGLAPIVVQNLFEIIKMLHKTGLTILLVEQNAYMALEMAEKAYVLENGQIVLSGKGSDLLLDEQVKKAYLGA